VAPVAQAPLHAALERRLAQEPLVEAVDRGREARDPGRGEHAAWPQHAARLDERAAAVGGVGEVIERAEREHRVGARVVERERAGVADPRARQRLAGLPRSRVAGLLDVQRHGIEQVRAVAALREPECVCAGAAAYVEHVGGRRRQVARQQLLRADELQPPPVAQPGLFLARGVVGLDRVVERHGMQFARPARVPCRRCGISARSACARARAASTSSPARSRRRCPS
jgi:hypothetical protein